MARLESPHTVSDADSIETLRKKVLHAEQDMMRWEESAQALRVEQAKYYPPPPSAPPAERAGTGHTSFDTVGGAGPKGI